MAYDPGAIDATLAAAVGDEPALIAELRVAFVESAEKTIAAIESATDDGAWVLATARLKGLAASFGAIRLMGLASDAAATPRDADAVRKLRRAVERL
jgi:HPt (histidine-containing phosphotransfer) domain-containing protein